MGLDHSKVDLTGRTPIGTGAEPVKWPGFVDDLVRQIREGVLEPGDEVSFTCQMKEWKSTPGTAAKAFDHLCRLGPLLKPSSAPKPYRVAGDDSWMRRE